MFGVSFPELLLVFAVVLIVLGPERLPDAAKNIGRWLHFFREQSDSVRRELMNSLYPPADEFQSELADAKRELRAVKEQIQDLKPERLLEGDEHEHEHELEGDDDGSGKGSTHE